MKGGEDMEQFSETLIEVLKEMCKRVGADYNSIDFKAERWFMEYTWTPEQQKDFEKWLVNYLYTSAKRRREFCSVNLKAKKYLRKVATAFTFNHGWSFPEGIYT